MVKIQTHGGACIGVLDLERQVKLMVKEILLQNGIVAMVDDEDYERCMEHTWSLGATSRTLWTVSTTINSEMISLQRFLLGLVKGDGKEISFLDKNRLNYQKNNLIIGDSKLKIIRRRGHSNSSSKYKGVSWSKRLSKWEVTITYNRKRNHLGFYKDEDEAAKIYNAAALKFFGENAYQNIIGESNNAQETTVEVVNLNRSKGGKYTKYKGVTKNIKKDKYLARIKIDGKRKSLGYFDTDIEAAKAYDKKVYELYGDKAILNFPEEYKSY